MAFPLEEDSQSVLATLALSWIGAGIQGRVPGCAGQRTGTDSAVKRTRGTWDGPPVGFGLGAVASGDSLAGGKPADEKRLRKRWVRSSITATKASHHEGHGDSASAGEHWADDTVDMPGVKKRPPVKLQGRGGEGKSRFLKGTLSRRIFAGGWLGSRMRGNDR